MGALKVRINNTFSKQSTVEKFQLNYSKEDLYNYDKSVEIIISVIFAQDVFQHLPFFTGEKSYFYFLPKHGAERQGVKRKNLHAGQTKELENSLVPSSSQNVSICTSKLRITGEEKILTETPTS